ncbi:bifunctional transcriptional activator/DNA repair enzyme AdaA [Nonomuraea insulae]|uniref:Bifunctional transcriptional activator/DNA repair enzyme AdaA n=1 Tax=Nonomuraea insulae TaxID=1616787 RepID=A0ABW1CXB4_9ACTN
MIEDEVAFAAMESRDPRFDGWFYVAVTTTGVYCRPSCPAVMPKPQNVRLFPTAAAAQVNGFRACKRCRPDAAPGSPEWNTRTDLTGRAMRLIADGIIDREGVAGLAARLGYSERQVHRQLVAEVGAGPQALARTQRAQTARMLLEAGHLPISDVAFAAGFASIRQFNETIRQVYATTPSRLRQAGLPHQSPAGLQGSAPAGLPHQSPAVLQGAASVALGRPPVRHPGALTVRLVYRAPMDVAALLHYLGTRAIPGLEHYSGGAYSRSLALPHGTGVVTLRPGAGHVVCELRLDDLRDLAAAVRRCRRLLDLDADQEAIDAFLGADPLLGPLVAARPGLRVPGCVDPEEMAFRAATPRGHLADLVHRYGERLATPAGPVTHLFPQASALAGGVTFPLASAPAGLSDGTLRHLARALADGTIRLDVGCDPHLAGKQLSDLPGMSRWAVAYIRMRALGDPDVLLPGLPTAGSDRWRPWRSYATRHLTASRG